MNAQTLGAQGEKFILDLLLDAGLDAVQGAGPGDILIESSGLAIEVKASLPRGRRRRYQFCLYRQVNGTVKTNAHRSDLVVLLAYATPTSKPAVFVIPSSRLNGQKSIKLPRELGRYVGKWSWFVGWDRAIQELTE